MEATEQKAWNFRSINSTGLLERGGTEAPLGGGTPCLSWLLQLLEVIPMPLPQATRMSRSSRLMVQPNRCQTVLG